MNKYRILIVEDEPVVAMDIESRLVAMNYYPIGMIPTGEQAVKVAKEQKPDLVLMDIRLKGVMDGIAAAQELRLLQIPVIFLTAYSEDETLEKAKLAEPQGFILKPFDNRELKSTIEIGIYKHLAEKEMRCLNRRFAILSEVNHAIAHLTGQEELLTSICRILNESGKIDLAWIGRLDSKESKLKPVANSGKQNNFLEQEKLIIKDSPDDQCNPAKAILADKPFVCQDCSHFGCSYPAGQTPADFGFRSSAAFPVRVQGQVWGTLNVMTSEPDSFQEKEVALLQEVAADLCFALDKMALTSQKEEVTQKLQKSEANYRRIVETANEGIWTSDADFKLDFVNHVMAEMLGYTTEEMIGRTFADFLFPEDLEDHGKRLESRKRGLKERYERRLKNKKGLELWAIISAQPIVDDDGNFQGSFAMITDITGRKKAEQCLQAEKDKLTNVLENLPNGIYIVNSNYDIEFANPVIQKDFGEVAGRKCYQYLHNRSAECPWYPNQKIWEGQSINWQFQFPPNGKFYDLYNIPLRNNDGSISKLAVFHDVTELKQSQERYRSLVEATSDWIWEVDNRGRLTYCSPQCLDILGYTSDEILGRTPFDFMEKEEAKRLREFFTSHVLEHRPFTFLENIARHKDGHNVVLESSGVPVFGADNALEGFRGINRDITQRKKAEQKHKELREQFHQAQKMEAIGTLAGGVAHDFNNILMAVMGYAEMMAVNIETTGKNHRYLDQILKACHRAKDLVAQILTFCRQVPGDKILLSPANVIKEVLQLMRASLPSTIEVRTSFYSSSNILGDSSQLHQVTMNLVANAFYAMQNKGGILDIELSDEEILAPISSVQGQLLPGYYVKLKIKDSGSGIDPAILAKIFEPYFTTKDIGQGTGLGLATVISIVKDHGGEIIVESDPGQGTTFQLFFPRLDEVAVESDIQEEVSSLRGKGRILFIDDEPPLVDYCQDVLTSLGYEVTAVNSSQEALKIFSDNPQGFDLVITDLTMPEITGIDLAKKLMKISPLIPVIVLTGYNSQYNREEVLAMGVKDFLIKPVGISQLGTSVQRVMGFSKEKDSVQ